MLTLDTEQIERQRRVTRFRELEHRNREAVLDAIEKKTFTVARDGEIATTDLAQQIGTPLSEYEFMRRLSLMNRHFVFEPALGDPTGKMGIYIVRNENGQAVKRFVAGMTRGYMPERSVRHMKVVQMPNPDPKLKGEFIDVETFQQETRGWRTVLIRLLRQRLITVSQIDRLFPPNLNSRNWQVLAT